MIIYQIHDISGEWEDYRDYIVGSYLSKEKAEKAVKRLQDKELELQQRSRDCNACEMVDWMTLEEFSEIKKDILEKCPHFKKVIDDRDGDISCRNTYFHWDEHTYEIKEVEVIE